MSDNMAKRYRHVYQTMIEDTTDGSRRGKSGSVRYESTRKGARTKKSKPWGKKR